MENFLYALDLVRPIRETLRFYSVLLYYRVSLGWEHIKSGVLLGVCSAGWYLGGFGEGARCMSWLNGMPLMGHCLV